MTLGQEFSAYATMIGEARSHIDDAAQELLEINMGATAIGTGINSPPGYAALVHQAPRRDHRRCRCDWHPTSSRRRRTPARSSSSPAR